MKRLALSVFFAATAAHAAITGTLIDESGKPVAGATVRAYAAEDSRARHSRVLRGSVDRPVIGTAQSTDIGTFRIDVSKTPLVELVIDAAGKLVLSLEAPDGEDLNAIVLRARSGQKLHLVDGGKPVANAMIVAGALLIRTDAEGSVELAEARGAIIHPDYAPVDLFFSDDVTMRDLPLSRGVAVRGRVLAVDGQPVANATISITGWPLAQSAADGSFTIAHAPANWHTVVATDATGAGVATNTRAASYDIRLKPAASVSGTTVPGARVTITSEASRDENDFVLADAQGHFDSGPLAASRYALRTFRRGYATATAELTLQDGARVSRNLPAKPLARISGRVVDEQKQPVAGAFVWFAGGLMPPRQDLVITGKNGEFNAQRMADSGPQVVYATKSMYALGTSGPIAEGKNDVTVTLPQGFPLQIRVIDKGRKSVSGAAVMATRGSDNEPFNLRYWAACEEPLARTCRITADDGMVRFRITEGPYDVRVFGTSIVSRALPQMLTAKSSPLTVEVERGVEVSGRVAYSDGTPVGSAFVSTRPFGAGARANDDGTFTLRNVSSGKIALVANLSDQPQNQSAPVDVDAPARNIVLTIPTPARIEGRVVDKETAQPVADFQIAYDWRDGRGGSFGRPSSFHSDAGSFLLDHLPAGPIRLQVAAATYAPGSVSDLTTEEGKTLRGVEVQLERGGQVRGRVTVAGAPVSGVNVRFGGGNFMGANLSNTTTDDNGEYLIAGVGAGDRTIDFYKEGFLPKHKSVDVVRGKETRLDVEMDRGRELPGRVVDKSGRPVMGARVSAMSTVGSGGYRPATSDSDGNFTLDGLADGRYTITATKDGYVNARVNDAAVPAPTPLTLTLDNGGTITGRVSGLSDAELSMTDVSASGAGSNAHARANPDGTFVLRGIPDGHVAVSAFSRGVRMRQSGTKFVDVINGSAPAVDIDFSEGISISGRVTRAGLPFASGNVTFSSSTAKVSRGAPISPDGRFEIDGLVAGDYDVSVYGSGGMMYRAKYSVAGNSTYDIQILGATLRGRVVDSSSGAPIGEANVWISPSRDYPMSRQTTTDSDGHFVLDAVPDGSLDVHVSSRQHFAPAVQRVVVSGGSAPDIELRLDRAQATAFRVVDAQSATPIDAFISVSAGKMTVANGGGARDDDGAIRLYLAPGHYKAYVNARGYVAQSTDFEAPGPDVRVTLRQAGRVLLMASKPTRVRLTPPAAGGIVRSSANSMASPMGTPMEGLAPGTYVLEVFGDDGKSVVRSMPVVITAGQTTTVNVD